MGGPFDMSREENASFVKTICLEAPESMMKLGDLDMIATKACTLSLSYEFDPPSFFFEQSGRDLQELGQHVNFILHTRALRMITLTIVCTLSHFSFILLLMGILLRTLGLLLRLRLVSLLLRWIFSFFISF